MRLKFLQPFYISWVILIFLATLFIVLPFYFLLSLPNKLWSKKGIWRLTSIWSRTWLRLTGLSVQQYGGIPSSQKNYVIIANHASYLDPIVIYDVLPFYFRPLAKYEISKAPLFGFIYAQIAILVDRNSRQSRANSMRLMLDLLHSNCSIFIYPEGTFNESTAPTKAFYDGAFRLAIEAQVPILPIIFPDTKERWHYSAWWKIWPGKNRAYLLDPLSVDGLNLADVSLLKEKAQLLMSRALLEHQKH